MGLKTTKIELTNDWQKIIDNSQNSQSDGTSFYVNHGSAIFVYDDDTPDVDYGMRISAGARIIPVPPKATLWGKLNVIEDECTVMVNTDN